MVLLVVVLLESAVILQMLYYPLPWQEVPFLKALSILSRTGERPKYEGLYAKQLQTSASLGAALTQCLEKVGGGGGGERRATNGAAQPEGVAVTLWLGSPKWFQNRFTMMLALVHAYLPPGWKIQIFHHPNKEMVRQALAYPGVQRLVVAGHVILTPLPPNLATAGVKRKDILLSPWLWDAVLAERVVTFGGTSVMCGNSPQSLADFAGFDYIGGPSLAYKGLGGDAGFTYRSKRFMQATAQGLRRETGYSRRDTGREDSEIASFWSDALKANGTTAPFRLAGRADSARMALNDINALAAEPEHWPVAAIGTLAGLDDAQRSAALDYCPELKVFFPSLVHPACFGASPQPALCFKYLCESGGLKCDQAVSVSAKTGKRGAISTISITPGAA